jgi:hypothetical protein
MYSQLRYLLLSDKRLAGTIYKSVNYSVHQLQHFKFVITKKLAALRIGRPYSSSLLFVRPHGLLL